MHGASAAGTKGACEESGPTGLESRPTINLFELWENGSHLLKLVAGRTYNFPKSLVVPCAWTHSPIFLSLNDAVRSVTPRCIPGRECRYCYETRSDNRDVRQHRGAEAVSGRDP